MNEKNKIKFSIETKNNSIIKYLVVKVMKNKRGNQLKQQYTVN